MSKAWGWILLEKERGETLDRGESERVKTERTMVNAVAETDTERAASGLRGCFKGVGVITYLQYTLKGEGRPAPAAYHIINRFGVHRGQKGEAHTQKRQGRAAYYY